jgi:Pyruvate/2-oxoacid:ferredoxin oxidoreductase delta subunit
MIVVKTPDSMAEEGQSSLPTTNRNKEFVVSGQLVTIRDREGSPPPPPLQTEENERGNLRPAEVLTIEEVARQPIDGIDTTKILNDMAEMGPQARLFLHRPEGQVICYELFEDPRICSDIHRGAVIENLQEKPKDVSGWRSHEFFIDQKGCLGDECGRCAVVCPENAIHLRGQGKNSFHEIDPLACKGCFICWVECVRTASDCILVDGKTFDATMRAKHFGE